MYFSGYIIVFINQISPERIIVEVTPNFIEFMADKKGFLIYCQAVVCDDDTRFKELDDKIRDIRIKILERMIFFGKNDTMTNNMFQRNFELLIMESVVSAQTVANEYAWYVKMT